MHTDQTVQRDGASTNVTYYASQDTLMTHTFLRQRLKYLLLLNLSSAHDCNTSLLKSDGSEGVDSFPITAALIVVLILTHLFKYLTVSIVTANSERGRE